MGKLCCIIGAGDITNTTINIPDGAFVISADGGYQYLADLGITPDLAMGDFDSLGYVPDNTEIIVFPCAKDYPDMMLAVLEAVKRGYDDILIYGAMGGRLDHTIGNLQMLCAFSQKRIRVKLVDNDVVVTAITDSYMELAARNKGTVSVFAFACDYADGVSIEGLKYQLTDSILKANEPLGVSNEFIGKSARISVRNGTLIIIYPSKEGDLI